MSLLDRHRLTALQLVADEEEVYRYGVRTVKACVQAERAYDSKVVRRLPYT